MSNSYISLYLHVVFRTKNNDPWLTADVCEKLYPYLGGIARDGKLKALAIGGVTDHIHLLLSLPADVSISQAMQLLKAASSRWIHETYPNLARFGWQEGYGAFSIGISQIDDTKAYIAGQVQHHKQKTFMDEYAAFLNKHGIAYENRYL